METAKWQKTGDGEYVATVHGIKCVVRRITVGVHDGRRSYGTRTAWSADAGIHCAGMRHETMKRARRAAEERAAWAASR